MDSQFLNEFSTPANNLAYSMEAFPNIESVSMDVCVLYNK